MDAQPHLPSPTILKSNSMQHEDVSNSESHTSVLPSSSSPASNISVSQSDAEATHSLAPVIPPVPTTWVFDPTISVPESLPSISTAIKLPGTDATTNPYAQDLSMSSIFPHHGPTTLETQPYSTVPYANTQPQMHLAPLHLPQQSGGHQFLHHPQPLVPVTLPPAASFDNCPQPYYFDY
jgi:hypothetical protein